MHVTFDRSVAAAAAAMFTMAGAAGCGDDMKNLSDPKVLGALAAANQGEVDYSQDGVDETTNDDVESFARRMIAAHTDELAIVRQAATETNLGIEESSTARELERNVDREKRRLEGRDPGRELDLWFMCGQIRLHGEVLETLDDSLEPSATNPRVRDLVLATRPVVAQHLQDARSILLQVNGSSEDTDGGGATHGDGDDTDGNSDENGQDDGGTDGPTTPEDVCRSRGGS